MQKLEYPREKIREAVDAALQKNLKEQIRMKHRIFELVGIPLTPEEFDNEETSRAIAKLSVDSHVEYLTDNMGEKELSTELKRIAYDYLLTNHIEGLNDMSPEEIKKMRDAFNVVMDNLVTAVSPHVSQEKTVQYYNSLFELARKEGIAPRDVFESDTLYKQLFRKVYTLEEYKKIAKKTTGIADPDKLLELFIGPIIKTLADDEDESSEMYDEIKKELTSNPEFQAQIKALKSAITQVVEEEIKNIYG